MACVGSYFECLKGKAVPPPRQQSKARVHAFLASRPKADLHAGEAASAGYWPWDSHAFQPLKDFLLGLFATGS